jgi:hypothetical protein
MRTLRWSGSTKSWTITWDVERDALRVRLFLWKHDEVKPRQPVSASARAGRISN